MLFPLSHCPICNTMAHPRILSPCTPPATNLTAPHRISSIDIVSHDFPPEFSSIGSRINYSVSI